MDHWTLHHIVLNNKNKQNIVYHPQAQMHVNNIEQRLSGQIRTKARAPSLPLSVEGQVNSLIEESTSIDNLCEMYIGWAAYM